MGAGLAARRSREPDDPLPDLDRWLKRAIIAVAGVGITYFIALFFFVR